MITIDNITDFNGKQYRNDYPSELKSSSELAVPSSETQVANHNQSGQPQQKNTELTIDSVLQEMAHWRQNKSRFKEPIPDELWQKIFRLAEQHGERRVRSLFGISTDRYQKKYQVLYPDKKTEAKNKAPPKNKEANETSDLEFCEVKTKHPIFEPLKLPDNTIIAEFRRADGQVMKIHCLSTRFQELINAFLNGQTHAANHTQT